MPKLWSAEHPHLYNLIVASRRISPPRPDPPESAFEQPKIRFFFPS